MYHIIKNVCKQMPPLPYAVREMATVSWRNKVILMGGVDKKGQILNNVVMYDTVTGESEMLPSMKYKRKRMFSGYYCKCYRSNGRVE